MKPLILIPDSLENPMGGMGEQARELITRFSGGCTIIGSPKQEYTDYGNDKIYIPIEEHSVPIGIKEPRLNDLVNQANYVIKASALHPHSLVHAFDWSTFYAGSLLSKQWNVPLVVTIQLSVSQLAKEFGEPPNEIEINQMISGIELMGLLQAEAIIQVSKTYVLGFPRFFDQKTVVIPNGIDYEKWQKQINYSLPGNRKYKIVFIGRLAYQKGIHLLLNAKIPEEIDLIFIGGNRGSNLELQDAVICKAKDNENIHYLGPLYGDEKIGALQAADAVIMPSVHEPFGIVALEALASKSVLISSFVHGMKDFLTEEIAINCGTSTPSIEESFNQFLKLSPEDKLNRINKGMCLCEQYSWNDIVKKVEDVYDQITSNICLV